jgi:hypothetical protein
MLKLFWKEWKDNVVACFKHIYFEGGMDFKILKQIEKSILRLARILAITMQPIWIIVE